MFDPRTLIMDKAQKIKEIATLLSVPPQWLDGILCFESNYNPQAKNPIPYNKKAVEEGRETPEYARGLIQFIDDTAIELGYINSYELIKALPDFDTQMDLAVFPYLQKFMPFRSEQDFYMAVFYPAYRKVSPATEFSAMIKNVNPGIVTVQDYIDKVNSTVAMRRIIPQAGGVLALLAAGVGMYLLFRG